MKRNFNIPLTILSVVLFAACAIAGVPLKWDVDTSKTTVKQFDAWNGETLDLEATLCAYRSAIDLTGKEARIYWQTNGMGSVYWQTNATVVASNVLVATFTPDMNPDARAIMGFIGVAGEIYRAAFSIRFSGSPGATPHTIELPVKVLDFATVEVLHPPYYTKAEEDGLLEDKADKTNTYTKAEIDGLIDEAGKVKSVNGKDGEVVLTASDVHALPDTYTPPVQPTNTNTVREIVSPMIGETTNGLRRVDDFAVYGDGFSDWECECDDAELLDLITGKQLRQETPTAWTIPEPGGAWYRVVSEVPGDKDAVELVGQYFRGDPPPPGEKTADVVFRRKIIVVPTSDRLATTNGVRVVETNLTAKLDAKRDLTNNVCTADSLGVWTSTASARGYAPKWIDEGADGPGWYLFHDGDIVADPGIGGHYFHSTRIEYTDFPEEPFTREKYATTGESFVTTSYVMNAMPNNGVMLTDGALQTKGGTAITSGNVGAASSEDVQTLNLGYQRLYSFSTGATNANISVTNYPPTAAEAEGRTHYDPNDPDLDFSTVPASMRLDEKRDGEKRTVVDTRDWPVWYFGCKLPRILAAAQEYAHTAYTNALAHLSAWADRTARGLENPAGESTLVIDVPNIWLMTDQTFEKHVSGSSSCWVIRSKNAAISPNVTTNGFLELTDAFGTPYIRFNKTEATFADPPASGIYHDDQEGEWIITYETTTKPKGGANLALQGSETYPGKAILKEEGDELCPAVITWTGSSGHWLMHAKPKQIAGADPDKMFFGAVVEVEGQDYIEYLKPVSFSHLVMPNGKKIAPDVPASASVGTIVNWKVVQ